MAHAWNETISIDNTNAKELIENQFGLAVNSITLLDKGWDNSAFLVNQALIFRFPRRELGVMCMENEIALLPVIKNYVSFPFSYPKWIGLPSKEYPYPFSGYPIIHGKPLCEATLKKVDDTHFAKTLAHWLKELHSIKIDTAYEKLIKGEQSWRLNVDHRVLRCRENFSRYEKYYLQSGLDKKLILDTIDFISYFKFNEKQRVFLHGDLYSRHIIIDPNDLSLQGLIDWGDAHIGYPGIDLAISMIFSKDSFTVFLNAYENVDDNTLKIAFFQAFCHDMSFLPYAYDQDNLSLKQWGFLQLNQSMQALSREF